MNPHPHAVAAMNALLDDSSGRLNLFGVLEDSGLTAKPAQAVVRYMYQEQWINGIPIEPADGSFDLLDIEPTGVGIRAVQTDDPSSQQVINIHNSGGNPQTAISGDQSPISQTHHSSAEFAELSDLLREILAAGELEDEGAEAARAALTVLEAETAPSVRRITLRHALDTIKVGGDIARLQALIEAVLGTIT